MSLQTSLTKLVKPDEGHPYNTGDGVLNFKLLSDDTQGQFAVAHSTVEPGGGPPPHIHHREDEMWIIVRGVFEFMANDDKIVARAGDIVYSPRNTKHTFKNIGETEGELYMVVTGGNFEKFYPRFSEALDDDPTNFGRLVQIAEEHGIEMV